MTDELDRSLSITDLEALDRLVAEIADRLHSESSISSDAATTAVMADPAQAIARARQLLATAQKLAALASLMRESVDRICHRVDLGVADVEQMTKN